MTALGARLPRLRSSLPTTALVVCAGGAYAVYSIVRQLRFESKAFDMGIYDHVVWQWSRFTLPANSIQGFPHELGDHFSPVYALLAPGYWIHSGPASALVGQAVLIALSIVAVERTASRRLGRRSGLVVAAAYALFWGVWSAVDFDFHETAFAAPLIAWAIDAADLRRWRRCALLLAGLLLVKEDMGLVVAAFGLWLLTQGARRQGAAAFAAGLAGFALVNGVVMPLINGGHASVTDQRLYGSLGSGPLAIGWHLVSHPAASADLLTHPAEKLRLLGLTFGAFVFLGLLSPLTIVALPQLVERLLTTDQHYWAPLYHYTLAIAPILAIGAADGLARLERLLGHTRAGKAAITGLTLAVLLMSVGSFVTGPSWRLTHRSFYERTDTDRARDAAVEMVPDDAPVAAQDNLLPHLSARRRVYQLSATGLDRARWIVDEGPRRAPAGWRLVFERDGVVVYRRG
jgi:uncharacterized membrane protein